MKAKESTRHLGLEDKHYKMKALKVPVIDSRLYTSLGLRLFEFYKKYKIEKDEQREVESLISLLTNFTIDRDQPRFSVRRLMSRKRSR